MRKKAITKSYNDGKQPRSIVIEIVEGNLDFCELELNCNLNEIESQILKQLEQLSQAKEINVISYIINKKEIPSYHPEHIKIRYLLAKTYCPHELLEPFEKIELELSDIYSKFLKSLKPPFDHKE